jgi:hypothetical protein
MKKQSITIYEVSFYNERYKPIILIVAAVLEETAINKAYKMLPSAFTRWVSYHEATVSSNNQIKLKKS